LKLGFFKDYLCVLVGCGRRIVADIWLMNVYGKRESWTKTVTVPYMGYNDYHTNINKALYISDDDQVLLEFKKMFQSELVVYDPIYSTLNIQDIENFNDLWKLEIYIESLIAFFLMLVMYVLYHL
jgi:hypothetical protein